MRAESPPLVSLGNVEKHYGDFHALKNVNLDIAEREVVVVIGPSGGAHGWPRRSPCMRDGARSLATGPRSTMYRSDRSRQ